MPLAGVGKFLSCAEGWAPISAGARAGASSGEGPAVDLDVVKKWTGRTAREMVSHSHRAPELALVHAWLDSWSGLGAIVVGMQRHDGWHCRGPGRGVSLAFP